MAFIGMVATGTPANLISLGAVDFGIVVDSTVIMMENIFRHLADAREAQRASSASCWPPARSGRRCSPRRWSSRVAFIPLFTLTGVSGVIFSPMAHTYAFAIGGAIILALTLTPVLAERVIQPGDLGDHEHDNWLMRGLKKFYLPLFAFCAAPQEAPAVAIGAVVVVRPAWSAAAFLGREFMPKLEEGNFWIRATLPTSISLEQSSKYVGRMRAVILGCPDAGRLRPRAPRAPGDHHRRLAAGAPRRRDRRLGLLQHRAVRAAAAVRASGGAA